MRPAISRVTIFCRIRAERPFFAVADGFQLVGGNTERDQRISGGRSAAISERQVVFSRASLVAVPLDGDDEVAIHREDLLERGGVGLQNGLVLRTDVALVVIEVNILHLVGKYVLNR